MAASGVKNLSLHNKLWYDTKEKTVPFSYMWTIYDFSLCKQEPDEELRSSIFSVGNDEEKVELQLRVYPRGHKSTEEVDVAVYLHIISCNRSKIRTDFEISILNAKNEKTYTEKTIKMIKTKGREGWTSFIDRMFLMDNDNELLPDDSLTLFCTGTVVVKGTVHVLNSNTVQRFDIPECHVLSDLGNLLESCKFTDVTISTCGEEIQAHKAILAARSTVFSAMFNCQMEEAKENRVEITDLEPEVIKELFRFIYTGKAPHLDEMASDLIMAADKYDLGRLKVMCAEQLFKTLTTDNAANILILADQCSEKQLKNQTIDFINTHLKHVMNTAEYTIMADSHPYLIEEILRASVAMQTNSGCNSHYVCNQRNTT